MLPQGYKNMDLESQDPIFKANLGKDENLIWTKKFRCSQPTSRSLLPVCICFHMGGPPDKNRGAAVYYTHHLDTCSSISANVI